MRETMSVKETITGLLPFGGSESETNGIDVLANLLAEREATLALEAQYAEPTVSNVGETTAVFPIDLYADDEDYGLHAKEFPLPDDGLDDADAPLTQFVAEARNVDADNVTFADLAAVEGMYADARLNEQGDIEVDTPDGVSTEFEEVGE